MENLLKRKLEITIKLNQAQQELNEEGNGFADPQILKSIFKLNEELKEIDCEIEGKSRA